jgi:hypothetical protein
LACLDKPVLIDGEVKFVNYDPEPSWDELSKMTKEELDNLENLW